MAALLDLEDIGIVDDRFGPVCLTSEFSPTTDDVYFGDGLGRRQQGFRPGDDLGKEGLEKFGFAGERLLVGTEHFAFLGPQFFGGEALGVHHRLLPDIIGRHCREIGFGNLDGIAKGAVITDLQGLDTGATLLITFELGDPALAVGRERTKSVEFGVETRA